MGNGIIHRADHGIVCIPKSIFKDESLSNEDRGILTTIIYFIENENDKVDIPKIKAATGLSVPQIIEYLTMLAKYDYAILVTEQ